MKHQQRYIMHLMRRKVNIRIDLYLTNEHNASRVKFFVLLWVFRVFLGVSSTYPERQPR